MYLKTIIENVKERSQRLDWTPLLFNAHSMLEIKYLRLCYPYLPSLPQMVCGSDGVSYSTPCQLNEESVRRSQDPLLPNLK